MNNIRFLITMLGLLLVLMNATAQPGAEIELNKPKKYEKRKLGAEKTNEKKFTVPRKIYQNTVTHYNYYFNANNRLNDLVTAAKSSFQEDYSQLLPFYNYTLQTTSQNKQELDSIVYKCTAGILLHDLRNGWIDNMYLLLAKAYLFRNDLDSATQTLQYLNFSFAPKEEGGYDIPIGSNVSNATGEFSIATKEKNGIFTKLTSRPPSRNESFIWQIRTFIEKDELAEAAGVIEILRSDPNFPPRLQNDLHEVLAYWFYKQQVYDSAAIHLNAALPNAKGTQERARWEYLIAQMYQLAKKYDESINFYNKSIAHTTDPVLDVYARLNSIRINHGDNKDYLQENINALLSMAKKDKYLNYRDIIYYAAASIELERKNYDNAQADLLKSVEYSTSNPIQRSQSFLLLADLNYDKKTYPASYNFYDSLDVNQLTKTDDKGRVSFRKPPLKTVAENTLTIVVQDSLQALAKLSPQQRDAIINKQAKKGRKGKALDEEDAPNVNAAVQQVPDLFADNSKSNDFYFYNSSQRARGFSEFKARWGDRGNVDNWRRKSSIEKQVQKMGDVEDVLPDRPTTGADNTQPLETSYEGLQANIPLTPEKLDASNKSIIQSLYTLGTTFMNKLEEYPSAIQAFEELLRRFPETSYRDEALFQLAYAYKKTGDLEKADQYKKQLLAGGANNKWINLINNPTPGIDQQAVAATKKYQDIYNLFIEGSFEQAKTEKKAADSVYGNSYWSPQLLFIESIYYIKQQEDSTAIKVLTNLVTLHAKNPMAERAKTMIDVLKRRKEIEDYLTNLQLEKRTDETANGAGNALAVAVPPVVTPPVVKTDTTPALNNTPKPVTKPVVTPPAVIKTDTTVAVKTPPAKPVTKPVVTPPAAKKDTAVAVKTPTQKPVTKAVVTPPITKTDTAVVTNKEVPKPIIKRDTTPVAPPVAPKISVKNFVYEPAQPHYVVVLLDKVDPVYASEAQNAFNRFNRERYSNQRIEMNSSKLDERFNLVLQGPFKDANAAVEYIDQVKPLAKSRILPWLLAEKYSFIIVNEANLELLKSNKDMDAYKQLLQKAVPGKF
jgi:outer membrane protein assembly factor BamD (BamD/ComL family)